MQSCNRCQQPRSEYIAGGAEHIAESVERLRPLGTSFMKSSRRLLTESGRANRSQNRSTGDAAPEWKPNPLLPAAHSSTLLWLFAVPCRMSAILPLPRSLLSTLYSVVSALHTPLSALHAPVPAAVRHGARHVHGNRATERWSDEAIE